jgi:hypothetical protein
MQLMWQHSAISSTVQMLPPGNSHGKEQYTIANEMMISSSVKFQGTSILNSVTAFHIVDYQNLSYYNF